MIYKQHYLITIKFVQNMIYTNVFVFYVIYCKVFNLLNSIPIGDLSSIYYQP